MPEGSGLAGPAIALGYGALGALIGLVLAAVLAWRLALRYLRPLALASFALATLFLIALTWRVIQLRDEAPPSPSPRPVTQPAHEALPVN
ncbi:MAG: hypothetical protein AAF772_04545 [Acidobacteriota bacterium]